MENESRWLLPEGIEESLPDEAAWLEEHRRSLLDFFSTWGYELVIPPLIEYLESLLIGPSDDLDLQTFKLTDQLTGRMMGVRADMTSQVARIDAHMLKRDVPTRFCYLGTVLHTRPSGHGLTRSPLQLGAELYGHKGVDSDLEIICLMLEALQLVGIENICLDLGHVGIFDKLMGLAGLDHEKQKLLQTFLQQKSMPEYEELLSECLLSEEWNKILMSLSSLSGNENIFSTAKSLLVNTSHEVIDDINYIEELSNQLKQKQLGVQIHYDLAALSGYRYQNGTAFAAYIYGQGAEIARGGRYDAIGQAFGRSRHATGFSLDLKALAKISPLTKKSIEGIYAPKDNDPLLSEVVAKLRMQGERVICELENQQGGALQMQCNRILQKENQQWVIKEL